MKHSVPAVLLLSASLTGGLARPAAAQTTPAPNAIYTYVEQMPELPGGGGAGAIRAAILKNLKYPAPPTPTTLGTAFVRFVVTATGEVANPTILKGVSADFDAAVLAAVRQLPRFVPGKQNGRAVSVSETIPVKQPGVEAPPPPNPGLGFADESTQNDSSKVYTYCEQMAALPSGGGQSAVVAAIQQRLVAPAGVPAGRVFVRFSVGPHGTIYDAQIVQGLSASADAAALAAVRQLPRLVPARQNGRVVAFSFTVPVIFGSPSPANR